jgi:flagella basal body P-ring formation protein FlgA
MDQHPAQPFVAWIAVVLLALAFTSLCGTEALAQTTTQTPPEAVDDAIAQQVRQMAMNGTHANDKGAPRVEVAIGQLDPRLRLAPCTHVEPYLPEGMRLWGKSRVGLRCTQGAVKWNVYLPVTVKVYGKGLVATNGGAAGAMLAAGDVTPGEVDLAEDSSAAVVDSESAVGRMLARAIKPGQSIRQTHLKARQWFSAGETVTVTAQGEGFSVAGEAQALNNGIEGQAVKVRTESGRVLTGQPVGERRVELPL